MSSRTVLCGCALAGVAMLALPGCKPYQSSPAGPCGGFYSEHEIERQHDLSVTNDGDDLVFRYTNVKKVEGRKPMWSMPGLDTLFFLHLHYEKAGVTVGCLDQLGVPRWKPRPDPDDPIWVLPAGHSVTARFSQERVWKSIRSAASSWTVLEDGSELRFLYDGFASNLCTVQGPESNPEAQRLVCTPSTPEQRAKENRQRKSWWDRVFKRDQKEIWHW